MKKNTLKWFTSIVVSIGIITGIQDGHTSFYEGQINKVDLSKKLSGFDGKLSKEKK